MSKHTPFARSPWRPYVQLRKSRSKHGSSGRRVLIEELNERAMRINHFPKVSEFAQQEARSRLRLICEWLKPYLRRCPYTATLPSGTKLIRLFDSLTIIRYAGSTDIHLYDAPDLKKKSDFFSIKLGRLKPNYFVVAGIVKHFQNTQGNLFISKKENSEIELWIKHNLFNILQANPDFMELFDARLPNLIGLQPDLVSIAMAARTNPEGPILRIPDYNIVRKYESKFRQLARENPQLLPLLNACCKSGWGPTRNTDPIQHLKGLLIGLGLSKPGWRYLAKHGTRILKMAWEWIPDPVIQLNHAVDYINALEYACFPPPPPPSVARAWLHAYNPHNDVFLRIQSNFGESINARILNTALTEADKRRNQLSDGSFLEDFLGVCSWAEGEQVKQMDKNQQKVKWGKLISFYKYRDWARNLYETANNKFWKCRLPEQIINGCHVIPLNSSADLILESIEMRNCLHNYVDDCQSGDVEIYSVRDIVTGKRKACLGFTIDQEGGHYHDAKGFANTPPTYLVTQIMYSIQSMLKNKLP